VLHDENQTQNHCHPRFEHGTSYTAVSCVTSIPLIQLNIPIEIKLLNCINAMGRNINQHSQSWGPYIFNKVFLFCYILTCMDNYISQFLKLRGVEFTAKVFCCVMMLYVFFVVLCVGFCTGHFDMVTLNLTYLHCLQHSLFEHLFNL